MSRIPSLLSWIATLACCIGGLHAVAAAERPNVLFLAIDDLKPLTGSYEDSHVRIPFIDRFAETASVFTRAYCQQAVCAPSRVSTFTGMTPDFTQVWDLKTHLRDVVPNAVTLPEHFKAHGYITAGAGKVLHGFKNNDF